jgi:hypothetical protein
MELSNPKFWILLNTVFYFLMNGAAIFETIVIIPQWSKNPPESLLFFRKPYALNLKGFWIGMHSIHEIFFIISIIMSWGTEYQTPLLIIFIIHMLIRVWTITYFAQKILHFEKVANLEIIVPTDELVADCKKWVSSNFGIYHSLYWLSFLLPLS